MLLLGDSKPAGLPRYNYFKQGKADAEADVRADCHEFFFGHVFFRRFANDRLPSSLRGVPLSEYERGYASVYDALPAGKMHKLAEAHASPSALNDLADLIMNGIAAPSTV